ncbi:MAG: ABC transporter permease [Pelolinea sp.]|nr:ABC transporter permease [Pelolinea sp.]
MSFDTVIRSIFSAFFIASVIRISTPIIFPAMGGIIAIQAGVSNMALEGIMNAGAFTGVIVSAYTGNVWLAVLCGMLAGVFIASLLALFHLRFNTNITLAGLALNLFCSGATVFLLFVFTGDKGNTSNLPSLSVPTIDIPVIKDIPVLGQLLSGHPVFTYLAFLTAFLVYIFLYRTRFGTHLRAVGENPEAATSLGINVKLTRFVALILSGVLAALGGMSLSMAYLQMFQREMAAGRGWIGLAAVWLGAKRPLGVLLASILFGLADAIANQLGSLKVPSQLVQMIPYLTTVVALVVYAIQQKQEIINRIKKYQRENTETVTAESSIKK